MGIIVDNASNNDTLFQFLMTITDDVSEDSCHIRCLAHIINLAAQDILAMLKVPGIEDDDGCDYDNETLDDIDLNYEIDDNEEVEEEVECEDEQENPGGNIIVKLRYVVRKIRKSLALRRKLKKLSEMYGIKYLVPVIDVNIRWNSSFYMIQRAEYLTIPLQHLCLNEKSLKSKIITSSEKIRKSYQANQHAATLQHSILCADLKLAD